MPRILGARQQNCYAQIRSYYRGAHMEHKDIFANNLQHFYRGHMKKEKKLDFMKNIYQKHTRTDEMNDKSCIVYTMHHHKRMCQQRLKP